MKQEARHQVLHQVISFKKYGKIRKALIPKDKRKEKIMITGRKSKLRFSCHIYSGGTNEEIRLRIRHNKKLTYKSYNPNIF